MSKLQKISVVPRDPGPSKAFYQVVLVYNSEVPDVAESVPRASWIMESHPLRSAAEADEILTGVTREVQAKLDPSEVIVLPPEQQLDDLHTLVLRKRETPTDEIVILARLGVVKIDYSAEIIH